MKKLSKSTKILIYSVIGLAALIAVVLILMLTHTPEQPDSDNGLDEPLEVDDSRLILSNLAPEDVVSISVKNQLDEYVIEHFYYNGESVFDITELLGAPRDFTKLNNAGRYASGLSARQIVSENETDFAKYGLAEDSEGLARMTAVFTNGEILDIYIGDETPTSEPMTYIRKAGGDDEDTIYIVWSYFVNQFKEDRRFYVSLILTDDYFESGSPSIERLEIEHKVTGHYVIEKVPVLGDETDAVTSLNLYRLTEPMELYLDFGLSESVVYGMFGLIAKEVACVGPAEDMPGNEITGFDEPYVFVEMTADGEKTTLTVGNAIWEPFYDNDGNVAGEVVKGYYVAYSEIPEVLYIFEPYAFALPFLDIDIEQIMARMFHLPYIYSVEEFIVETNEHTLSFTLTGSSNAEEEFFLDGEKIDAQSFKNLYQFCIGARAESLFEGDSVEGMEFLARFTYKYRNEARTVDVIEFYDSGDRRLIITKNDVPMFVGRLMFITRLEQNIEAFFSDEPLIMAW
ncbi:MAG: DUF4340 domain-containing protein [Oscillospiraceae bacterium]|nr:DUF4340 domain-containing protein [Oscillospiraceae bacterium]